MKFFDLCMKVRACVSFLQVIVKTPQKVANKGRSTVSYYCRWLGVWIYFLYLCLFVNFVSWRSHWSNFWTSDPHPSHMATIFFTCRSSPDVLKVNEYDSIYWIIKPMGILPDMPFGKGFFYKAEGGCIKFPALRRKPVKFEFLLDPLLTANVTITKLYSSVEGDKTCRLAFLWFFQTCNWLTSTIDKLCGIYSQMNVYTKCHNFEIRFVPGNSRFPLTKEMFFSVMQRNYVLSHKPQHHIFVTSSQLEVRTPHTCFVSGGKCIFNYMIRVEHFKYIILRLQNIPEENCQVYDGPGDKSDLVAPSSHSNVRHQYSSSSFQMFLTLILNATTKRHPITFDAYMAKEHFQAFTIQNTTLSFPSKLHCNVISFCILKVHSSENWRISFTLSAFNSSGDALVHNCQYAGLSLYSMESEAVFQHSHTQCVKQHFGLIHRGQCTREIFTDEEYFLVDNMTKVSYFNPKSQDSKTIIFNGNSTLLIYYFYKEYAGFGVNVRISRTQCKGLLLDVCKLGEPRDFIPATVDFASDKSGAYYTLKLPWSHQCYAIILTRTRLCSKEINFRNIRESRYFLTQKKSSLFLRPQESLGREQRMDIHAYGTLVDPSAIQIFRHFKLGGDMDCKSNFWNQGSEWKPCTCTSGTSIHWTCHKTAAGTLDFRHIIDSPISHDRRMYVFLSDLFVKFRGSSCFQW